MNGSLKKELRKKKKNSPSWKLKPDAINHDTEAQKPSRKMAFAM